MTPETALLLHFLMEDLSSSESGSPTSESSLDPRCDIYATEKKMDRLLEVMLAEGSEGSSHRSYLHKHPQHLLHLPLLPLLPLLSLLSL